MLESVDKEFLDEILGLENCSQAIKYLISEYAKLSVTNASYLLRLIPEVSDIQLNLMAKESSDRYQAAFWLINQNYMTDDERTLFASMTPICKVMFPSGNAFWKSIAMQNYFCKFMSLFRNPKAFSWNRDKTWAEQYGYTEYLKLVESQMEA